MTWYSHCERSEVPLSGTPLMCGTQEQGNLVYTVSLRVAPKVAPQAPPKAPRSNLHKE